MGAAEQFHWSDDENAMLADLLKDGKTFAQAAPAVSNKFGVKRSRSATISRARRMGLVSQSGDDGGRARFWSGEILMRASDLWSRNVSQDEIAHIFGVTRKNIQRLARTEKWPVRACDAVLPVVATRFTFSPMGVAPAVVRAPTPIAEIAAAVELPTLVRLGARCCKWPIGNVRNGCGDEQRFCGENAAHDGNYCSTHHRAAYRVAA